jgi:hypothetical protein
LQATKGEKRDDLLPFLSHPLDPYFEKVIWHLKEKGSGNGEEGIAERGRE